MQHYAVTKITLLLTETIISHQWNDIVINTYLKSNAPLLEHFHRNDKSPRTGSTFKSLKKYKYKNNFTVICF